MGLGRKIRAFLWLLLGNNLALQLRLFLAFPRDSKGLQKDEENR